MGITALPYTAVLAVPASRIIGNDNGTTGPAEALTAAEVRTLLSVYTTTEVDTLLSGKAAAVHVHAASDITSGALDIARIPTGTTSSTVCIGNDSRLSDARTPTAHKASHATGGTDALSPSDIGAVPTSRTLTINGTAYDLSANRSWTVSGGIGGGTGSVDNAMLRADGTGGSTAQASDWLIADNYTASPNNTVNHASLQATGSTTNVSVSVVPKGSGAFSLSVPDGTSTGGNARGANAVDLQTVRSSAAQVASGAKSALIGVSDCTVSVPTSIIIGSAGCSITGGQQHAIIASDSSTLSASSMCAMVGGYSHTTGTVNYSVILGGQYARMRWSNAIFHSTSRWSTNGDCQSFYLTGSAKTTTNSAVEINFGLGVANAPAYLTLAAGVVMTVQILIQGVKSDGSVMARYCRHATIRRVGATITLVSSDAVGTDIVNGTSISITADGTNYRLAITVTGVASETWRWNCIAQGIEQEYGT